jgi:hypothetical protein
LALSARQFVRIALGVVWVEPDEGESLHQLIASVLLGSAAITAAMGHLADTMVILAVVIAMARGSPHPIDDVIGFKYLVSYSLMYFVAYYSVVTLSQARFLLVLVMLVFVVAAFEAIAQGIAYGFDDFDHARRASGPFGEEAGNSNFGGVFYAIFSTFSLAIALLGKSLKFRYRAIAMAFYVIGCMAIVATFSRQAFLVITVTTLLLALWRNPMVAVTAIAFMLAYP